MCSCSSIIGKRLMTREQEKEVSVSSPNDSGVKHHLLFAIKSVSACLEQTSIYCRNKRGNFPSAIKRMAISHEYRSTNITRYPTSTIKNQILASNPQHNNKHGFLMIQKIFIVNFTLKFIYLRGMNLELWVAPIPGRPCLTGL